MTTIYEIKSHERHNTPAAKEPVFTGNPQQADDWYNGLTHPQRCDSDYLFSDDGSEPVRYQDWKYAGISAL